VGATSVDRSTLADVVRRLVKQRLATRKRNKADSRAYDVALTDEGRAQLQAARKAARQTDKALRLKIMELLRQQGA
jgi:DNA-binding MarR family transcriptional regulator